MPYRYDFGRIRKATPTPQGGIKAPASLTRTGILTYRNADGTTRKEYRPADEVFSLDSLASLASAPITDLHPDGGQVTPANYRSVSVGHVAETVRRDGEHVAADLLIQDAATIARVDAGERAELSCGYACDLDLTPGTHAGERYDAIQRSIRYNHVAIGPVGWGRAGSSCAIRLDATDAVEIEDKIMATMRVDGIEYEAGSPSHLQAQERHDAKLVKEAADAKAEAEGIRGRLDAATAELASTKTALASATDPARMTDAVNARVALVATARETIPDYRADGKTDSEIMIACIRVDSPDFDPKDRSPEYIRGRFEGRKRTDGVAHVREALSGAKLDAAEVYDSDAAAKKMRERNAKLAAGPLAVTKGS